MRRISNDIAERLSNNIQTKENNANPSATVWVTRPTTNLISDDFLDRQTILEAPITDVSIAACHPYKHLGDSHIYIGYISSGHAKVIYAETKTNILGHFWNELDFNESATAISIAFNGTMEFSMGDKVEIVTEKDPWIFWITQGRLLAKKNDGNIHILCGEDCTDVSAIRAVWSSNGVIDFGLVVFFILNKKLHYRQLIGNEWMDAEEVNFGPSVEWGKISAFRTWDYRIGVQAQAVDGTIYELFTQFMGIGRRNSEHIDVSDIKVDSDLKEIRIIDSNTDTEHIDVRSVVNNTPYGGLYSATTPEILSVINIRNDDGDWGRYVQVIFNNHINTDSLSENVSKFILVDSDGKRYIASTAMIDSDGKTVIIDFINIHSAIGECTLTYSNGTLISMADIEVPDSEFIFTPVHLDGSDESLPPEPVDIWNTSSDGTEIAIRFTSPIISELSNNEDKFTITINEYNYYPGGTISSVTRSVSELKTAYCSAEETIDLYNGDFTDTILTNAGIRLEVDK